MTKKKSKETYSVPPYPSLGAINALYDRAELYYQAREKAFGDIFKSKFKMEFKTFLEKFNELYQNTWNRVAYNASYAWQTKHSRILAKTDLSEYTAAGLGNTYNAINNRYKSKDKFGDNQKLYESFTKLKEQLHAECYEAANKSLRGVNVIEDGKKAQAYQFSNKFGSKVNVYQSLGDEFEVYLTEKYQELMQQILGTLSQEAVKELVQQVGSMQVASATAKDGNKITSTNDILFNISGVEIDMNGKFANDSGHKINSIDIKEDIFLDEDAFADGKYLEDSQSILYDYIHDIRTAGVGGVNVKSKILNISPNTRKNTFGRLMNSAQYQAQLESKYKAVAGDRKLLTAGEILNWNFYFYAQRLINILTPSAVFIQSGNGQLLISQFLKTYLLYNPIKYRKTKDDNWNLLPLNSKITNLYKLENLQVQTEIDMYRRANASNIYSISLNKKVPNQQFIEIQNNFTIH